MGSEHLKHLVTKTIDIARMGTNPIKPQSAPYTVGIVGVGRLGGSLALHFLRNQQLRWILHRSPTLPSALSSIRRYQHFHEILQFPSLIFLTVRDSQIRDCVNQLSQQTPDLHHTAIVHCSGALDITVLTPLQRYGATIGVLHPFQMFPLPDPALLRNIVWTVECIPDAFSFFNAVIDQMGGKALWLNETQRNHKSWYHIAAVAASNALLCTLDLAQQLLDHCNLPATHLLPSITRTALMFAEQAMRDGHTIAQYLTGPIVRGDTVTLQRHLETLTHDPQLESAYRHLLHFILDLAHYHRLISEEQFRQINSALQTPEDSING